MSNSSRPWVIIACIALVAALAAIIIAIVTAVSSEGEPTPSMTPQERYLSHLDDLGVPYGSTSSALDLGDAICRALESGVTHQQAVEVGGEFFTTEQSRGIVGAAVESFCPGASTPAWR